MCVEDAVNDETPAPSPDIKASPSMSTCRARTRRGTQCQRNAQPGSEYCWQHEPRTSRWITGASISAIITVLVGILGITADLLGVWPLLAPQLKMTGDYRIAVAAFDQEGINRRDEVGLALSQGIHSRLAANAQDSDLGLAVEVWGPDSVPQIRGDTVEARAERAAAVADRIGADVVVYGLIEADGNQWRLLPEFYVDIDSFYQAAEITGQHTLGDTILLHSQGQLADRLTVSEAMEGRTQVLSDVVIGLAHYSRQDYDSALDSFDRALRQYASDSDETETASTKAQDTEQLEAEGAPILQMLVGNAALKLDDLSLAHQAFSNAVSMDADYARGYMGMATVRYLEALQPFETSMDPSDTDLQLLTQAEDYYTVAMDAANKSPLADVDTRARFGLGQVELMRTYAGAEASFTRAVEHFEAVIDAYDEGRNPRVQTIAAESHARLGLIYGLSGRSSDASVQYQKAAELIVRDPERRAHYEERSRQAAAAAEEAE